MNFKDLTEPSYKSIRIADFFNILPISLSLRTRKIRQEDRILTKIVCRLIYTIGWIKPLQILYALVDLLRNYKQESLPVVILTALWLSLCSTAIFWSYELFHRGIGETIILFNSLAYEFQRMTNLWKDGSERSSRNFKPVRLLRAMTQLSLQELLCVMTPFAVKLFVPVYVALMIIFPQWSIFSTSIVFGDGRWTWKAVACAGFEVVSAFGAESNILFLFFFQLALQVMQIVKLRVTVLEQRYVANETGRTMFRSRNSSFLYFGYGNLTEPC